MEHPDSPIRVEKVTLGQFKNKYPDLPLPKSPITAMSEDKPDCRNHKREVAGISDMKILAEQIGDLHYKTLTELFIHLSRKIDSDAEKDNNDGR